MLARTEPAPHPSRSSNGCAQKRPSRTDTPTVTNAAYGSSASVGVVVTAPAGQIPTGQVSVTAGGSTQTVTLDAQGRASVALPRTLAPKTYAVTAVYSGNSTLVAASSSARVTIGRGATKAPAFAPRGTVKAKKKGKATVTVAAPSGLAKATGKVTIRLKRGKATKNITATVRNGRAAVNLPKLAKGSWSVKVTYRGDASYAPTKAVSIRRPLKVKG
jgi:hypothetical protein|nr:hypothetical protein [Aeromicrobium sp.]